MTDGPCAEKQGFLFKHACEFDAVTACTRCSKAICDDHSHADPTGEGDLAQRKMVCTTCVKTLGVKQGRRNARHGRGPRGGRGYQTVVFYDSDPYFYDDYYYEGYGDYDAGWYDSYEGGEDFDPSDFTEADGESFAEVGDEGFEDDFGAS